MGIRIVRSPIAREDLAALTQEYYADLIKGVVDIRAKVIALGGEMHSDGESLLLQEGSSQPDIWGFNILTDKPKDECLVYTSFVNIRPRDNNKGLEVLDPGIREKMRAIIFEYIPL